MIVDAQEGTQAPTDHDANVGSALPAGAVRLSTVVRLAGEHQAALREAMGDALIVESFDQARELAAQSHLPVATLDGDVLRGMRLVAGGSKTESRGILATKREIKELRVRAGKERADLDRLSAETAQFEASIAHATAAVAALAAELHRQEKDIVGVEAQLQRARDDETRLMQRRDLVATETRRVVEEIEGLDIGEHGNMAYPEFNIRKQSYTYVGQVSNGGRE